MKIVVPVAQDKQTIYQRTGHAPYYAIYEDGKISEYIQNEKGKGEHGRHEHEHENHHDHVSSHKKDISELKECDVILVQMIGEHMREAVESLGIKVKKIRKKDGNSADEVVDKFLKNELYKKDVA